MTTVATIMSRKVTTVPSHLPLYDLICLLVDSNVSGAPVVDAQGRAIGMVSKSDLVWEDHDWAEGRRALISWKRIAGRKVEADEDLFDERNLANKTVADVMTSGALSVLPSTSIKEASRLMISNRVHRLPVVDEHELLVGIVTTFDVTRWVAQADAER
ncbi:MAG: putative transcriptional regulator, contains C-terminal domain [Myxococcaceae bacterium]|nr:putative transcriptional regulator, contains C-terminal domain [Myxococcaceae bacterium]